MVFEQLARTLSELQRSFPRAVKGKEILMARVRNNTVPENIREHSFLAEVFGEYADKDTQPFHCWSWRNALSSRSQQVSGRQRVDTSPGRLEIGAGELSNH
jgi:hypothetical protein